MIRTIAIVTALGIAAPVLAQGGDVAGKVSAEERGRLQEMDRAMSELRAGRHDAAVAAIDPVIVAYDKQYAGEKRMLFCGFGMTETLSYMMRGAVAKRGAVALGPGWCDALFLKGFILSDAKRYAEAQPWIERAIAMAPSHAHYLNELGFVLQRQRQWQSSLDAYARAVEASDLSDAKQGRAEKGRAWRGMGFALIEQGKWDEARAVFEKCLALDPADAKAKNELQYIAENRPKAT